MGTTRRNAGVLAPQVEGYRDWLTGRGYTPGTIRNMLKDLGQVGLWLSARGLAAAQLDADQMELFLSERRRVGHRSVPGARAMVPMVSYLRQIGVVEDAAPSLTPLGELLALYRSWMVQERGLARSTVLRYENTARHFLQQQAMVQGVLDPAVLTGVDVNSFLLRECGRVSTGSAKGRVGELRSVLRFLYLRGLTPLRLGTAVPPVGGWRLATLPAPAMTRADVQSLLEGCDRATDVGVRDFAIITLLARLGLRSIEVARMELDDVDWRAAELVVRGKGGARDRLPLPAEVGEALVAYLSGDRKSRIVQGHPRLFLTCRAPRQPIRADLVGDVVERACLRAGLPRVGPHRLRHSLAAELLRQGAGLVAISQVLRHQDLATTALYAKVDLDTLRQVTAPWPGAL